MFQDFRELKDKLLKGLGISTTDSPISPSVDILCRYLGLPTCSKIPTPISEFVQPISNNEAVWGKMGEWVFYERNDEKIRMAAYLKWEAAGKPEGDGKEFWLQAEQEENTITVTIHSPSESRLPI